MSSQLEKVAADFCELDGSFISSRFGTALLWFLVSFITSTVVLYIVTPQIVKKKDDNGTVKNEVDFSKVFIASTIISMIIGIIGYAIRGKCALA